MEKRAQVLLEGGALDDAGVGDGDAAPPIDKKGERHGFEVEAVADSFVADDDRVEHAFPGGEGADQLRSAVVHGDADNGEAFLTVLAVELDVPGQLDLAAAAPGGPEVKQDDFAAEFGEGDRFPVEVGESEVWSELAIVRRDEGVWGAECGVGQGVALPKGNGGNEEGCRESEMWRSPAHTEVYARGPCMLQGIADKGSCDMIRVGGLRCAWLLLGGVLLWGAWLAWGQGFEVVEATVVGTQGALLAGRVTCAGIVEAYLRRIAVYDQATGLNSVVVVNPEVRGEAAACDREVRTGKIRRLTGVAVMVKDNYDTRGLQTTGGSLAMKGFLPTADATMVRKLREAGAMVLGKSNMAEWAFSPYVTMSSIGGTTRNAYDLGRVPAGSSGGTAASVAASLAEVGLGTDTGNSIRGPSAHNDLVGIRPTIGLVSRAGIIPLFRNNDVGGPMARTVADAAAVLTAVAGYDAADAVTERVRGRVAEDYTKDLDAEGLRGARIGYFHRYADAATTDAEVRAVTERALGEMRAAGATVVAFDLPEYQALTKDLWCGDFAADLDGYLRAHPGAPVRSTAEVVASGLYLPYIAEELTGAVGPAGKDDRRAPCEDVWHDAPKVKFRAALLAAMDAARVDAVVYPTWSNPPRKVGDMTSPAGDNSQVLSPQTGFPAMTVPMGFTHGDLPAGMTFLGREFAEGELIKLAYGYEQGTHHRRAPERFPALATAAAGQGGR